MASLLYNVERKGRGFRHAIGGTFLSRLPSLQSRHTHITNKSIGETLHAVKDQEEWKWCEIQEAGRAFP
jgi:hypothetical protein